MAKTLVQSNSAKDETGVSTAPSVTLPSPIAAGDLLVCFVGANENGGDVTVTAPSGFTQVPTDGDSNNTGNVRQYAFYKIAGASESQTVTAALSAGTEWDISVQQFNDSAGGIWVIDKSGKTTGSSANPTTGSLTSTLPEETVFVAAITVRSQATFSSPTNSFTIQETQVRSSQSNNGVSHCALYRIASSGFASPQSGSVTLSNSRQYSGQIVTFITSGSPSASASPTPSSSPSPSSSVSASVSKSPSLSPSPSSSVSPSVSPSSSVSRSLSPSASPSPSASVSPSSSVSPSVSPSASDSPSSSVSSSVSPSLSASTSQSLSPSASASPSASVSPSASTSQTPSPSVSPSSSVSSSASRSASPSASVSPSVSPSASASLSPSSSASRSASPSASISASISGCHSPSPSVSASYSPSPSPRHFVYLLPTVAGALGSQRPA